jgi:hypothetical protein
MFKASQGSGLGSIPVACSINRDDSIVLTPLTPLISAIKPGGLVPRWSQMNELVPTSRPKLDADGRRSWQLDVISRASYKRDSSTFRRSFGERQCPRDPSSRPPLWGSYRDRWRMSYWC